MRRTLLRRLVVCTALLVLTACSRPAGAQAPGDLSGTWALRTEAFSDDPNSSISGAAVFAKTAPNQYSVRLVANQYAPPSPLTPTQAKPRGEPQDELITAREACDAQVEGLQVNITCRMAEPLASYSPDNFVLQAENADTLVGVLTSGADAQVTFSRVR